MLMQQSPIPASDLLGKPQDIPSAAPPFVSEVGVYDVLCGRDKEAFNNVGNRRFRVTVSLSLDRYKMAHSRKEKSTVIKSVAALVKGNGGKFLHKKKGAWVQLNEKQTHEKVGHALRDMAQATAATKSSEPCETPTDNQDNNNNKRSEHPVLEPVDTKRQKSTHNEIQEVSSAPVPFDSPDELDAEALRMLSESGPELDTIGSIEKLFDDEDDILSFLLEESDVIVNQIEF